VKWGRVRSGWRCAFGCELRSGTYAWLGRWIHSRKFVLCRACGAARYELVPPVSEERDVKALQIGEDA
jgi:hypothetical protein